MIRWVIKIFVQELLTEIEKRYNAETVKPLDGPIGSDEDIDDGNG